MNSIISNTRVPAALVLADGTVFKGYCFGAKTTVCADLVVDTAAMGYQETMTDSNNHGKIIVFTYPHIGNVGINRETLQDVTTQPAGIVIRCESPVMSHFTATNDLASWLNKNEIVALADIDTRRLVRHLRDKGQQKAAIVVATDGELSDEQLRAAQVAIQC